MKVRTALLMNPLNGCCCFATKLGLPDAFISTPRGKKLGVELALLPIAAEIDESLHYTAALPHFESPETRRADPYGSANEDFVSYGLIGLMRTAIGPLASVCGKAVSATPPIIRRAGGLPETNLRTAEAS